MSKAQNTMTKAAPAGKTQARRATVHTAASVRKGAERLYILANQLRPEWCDEARAAANALYLTVTGSHPVVQPKAKEGHILLAQTSYDGTKSWLTTPGWVLRGFGWQLLKQAVTLQSRAEQARLDYNMQRALDAQQRSHDADTGPDGDGTGTDPYVSSKSRQAAERYTFAALAAAHWTEVAARVCEDVRDLGTGQEVEFRQDDEDAPAGKDAAPGNAAVALLDKFLAA